MTNQRTHYVTTSDGVAIGGAVHGQGPNLVLMQGIIGDGDLDWRAMLPHLTDTFTCHLPSLRGRGLSGDHPNLTIARHVEDMHAYVDSLGDPVGLVGWSGGGNHALGVAAKCDAVSVVVPFEPVVQPVMDEATLGVLGAAIGAMAELAAAGRPSEGARAFGGWPFTDEEIAAADATGYFESAARYVPLLLGTLQALQEHGDPTTAPSVLDAISAAVVVLRGSATKPVFSAGAQFVVDRVANARLHELPGAGHAAPLTHPEPLAHALVEIFATAQRV